MLADDLLNKGLQSFYEEDQDAIKQEFFNAVKETAKWQYSKCALYHQFSKGKNFDPNRNLNSIEDLKDIPYLTTANFKGQSGRPKELLTVPEDDIYFWGLSSGTSGDPSTVGRDRLNVKRVYTEMQYVMEMLGLIKDGQPMYDWILLFMPPLPFYTLDDEGPITQSQFMYFYSLSIPTPNEERVYALKRTEGEVVSAAERFTFDPETTYGFLNSIPPQKGKGWIGGSVPLMYQTLTGYYQNTGQGFTVDPSTIVSTGGGWKSFSGEAVNPEQFREGVSSVLSIPKENIRDMYQFTETDGVFEECEHFHKHVFPWIDVIVRDVETLEPVEVGEKGLINVINPLAHSYAGVSVLQDDIVRIVMDDGCPCGRRGKVIEILGRAEGAEAKGCGAQIAEMTDT